MSLFRGVKKSCLTTLYRAKFLELAADSLTADSLYLVPEDGGGSRLEMGQYKERQSHLSLLGKMWFMSDKAKQFQVGLQFEIIEGSKYRAVHKDLNLAPFYLAWQGWVPIQ